MSHLSHSAQFEVELEAVRCFELLLSRNIDVRTPVCNLIGPKQQKTSDAISSLKAPCEKDMRKQHKVPNMAWKATSVTQFIDGLSVSNSV